MAEPLRAMVMGAPLEDARHLAQRYDRMRQEAEAQVFLNKAILLGYIYLQDFSFIYFPNPF